MKTAFTADEIRHMPPDARSVFRHWTLKEAFLKYLGLGFNESLHHVAVINDQIYHYGRKQLIDTWSYCPDDRYVLSLVFGRKNDREATWIRLPGPVQDMSKADQHLRDLTCQPCYAVLISI